MCQTKKEYMPMPVQITIQIPTKFQITKLEEAGYHSAVTGVSLSYNTSFVKATSTVIHLRDKDFGENKFLESIQTWWNILAPRYWWQEMDTYRIGITKQSESTIHTLKRKPLTNENFAQDIPDSLLQELNTMIEADYPLDTIKNLLPEGFLQRRIVNVNYKSLRNMILQRRNHKLKEWRVFCDEVLKQVNYPYLLPVKD
jgi:hypothetical protein